MASSYSPSSSATSGRLISVSMSNRAVRGLPKFRSFGEAAGNGDVDAHMWFLHWFEAVRASLVVEGLGIRQSARCKEAEEESSQGAAGPPRRSRSLFWSPCGRSGAAGSKVTEANPERNEIRTRTPGGRSPGDRESNKARRLQPETSGGIISPDRAFLHVAPHHACRFPTAVTHDGELWSPLGVALRGEASSK